MDSIYSVSAFLQVKKVYFILTRRSLFFLFFLFYLSLEFRFVVKKKSELSDQFIVLLNCDNRQEIVKGPF